MTYDEAIRELSVQYLGDSDKMREAKDFAISVLKNDNWIPFDDDHKPETGKEVIYSLKALPEINIPNRIGIDCYFPNDHEWWKENVRGWMPAPKTYVPNAEEKKTTGHVHLVSGNLCISRHGFTRWWSRKEKKVVSL